MNTKITQEIQAEQEHGRSKYGSGPHDFPHDDATADDVWHRCIADHNERARLGTPMERRQHLIKLAGLAVSAVESFDRKHNPVEAQSYGDAIKSAQQKANEALPVTVDTKDTNGHCGWSIVDAKDCHIATVYADMVRGPRPPRNVMLAENRNSLAIANTIVTAINTASRAKAALEAALAFIEGTPAQAPGIEWDEAKQIKALLRDMEQSK